MRLRKKHLYDFSYKENPNAVFVGRPSKYGNPFKVSEYGLEKCLRLYREWLTSKLKEDPKFLELLRGKDLVCYCRLDQKCHADIIMELLK